jgi:signal transduction histidine kinase
VVRAEVDRRLVTLERTMADLDRTVADLLEVTRQLTDRLDAPAATRAARLLLAVAAAKEATGRERSLLAATRAGAEPATARPAATGRARAAGNARAQAPPAGDAPDQAPPARTGPDRFLVARLTAAAAVARHELIGVRAVAGERLDEVDRALAVPGARRARGLELALLQPAEGAPALADPGAWRAGLAGRAAGPQAVAAATVPGLARRGQALAERQLQLLEELVRDKPDPRRRRGLLGVDHLGTRLRRTTETLLAMTGPEPPRRWAGPVPLAQLLRAAVAEAEANEPSGPGGPLGRGRRIDLLASGDVEVTGAAAADLVHLLAELLDNAASFSPPGAAIVVTAAADGDGHLIEVADRGLGMTGQELARANQRLAGDPSPTRPAGPPATGSAC